MEMEADCSGHTKILRLSRPKKQGLLAQAPSPVKATGSATAVFRGP